MKKNFAAIFILLLPIVVLSSPSFQGVYVGGELGFRHFDLKEKGRLTINGVLHRTHKPSNNFQGGIFLGTGLLLNHANIYGGFELSASTNSQSTRKYFAPHSSYIIGEVNSGGFIFRGLIKIGYLFTPKVMAYLQAGFGSGTTKIVGSNTREIKSFPSFGFGVSYAINFKWGLRLSYLYDKLSTQKLDINGTYTFNDGRQLTLENAPYNTSPEVHNILLGISYQI